MFKLVEASLADTHRLYQYKLTCKFPINLNLKSFGYGWLLSNHEWKPGEKVLDVGGAYSDLPIYLQKTYGCETWVVDDFGISTNDPFWTRNQDPRVHIAAHPEVKYVLERVGDENQSSLPLGYFDVVYSVSALEHVPSELTLKVWRHMGALIKPGGALLNAIDVSFPSNEGLKKISQAVLFDTFNAVIPENFRLKHFLATPNNYTRLVFQALRMAGSTRGMMDVLKMSLDPQMVTEPLEFGYNRIVKDNMQDYAFQRIGSLLLHIKKTNP